MLKRKNDRQPPQRLEEERYPNDYWLDEEDGGEDIPEPADSSKPVSGRLHSEPMVTGYEALERQRGVRRPNRKLTRREKKALKRAQKYEAKLHKEQLQHRRDSRQKGRRFREEKVVPQKRKWQMLPKINGLQHSSPFLIMRWGEMVSAGCRINFIPRPSVFMTSTTS